MRDEREIRVAERPGRPLLVFDGDCGFCRQWVERWRGITEGRVEYRPSQEVAGRFPEIGPERFRARVWLIESDGRATGGARAVFRLYATVGEKRWLGWSYENVPGFAGVAEGAYDLVARHRKEAAVATRWLWGKSVERPRYRRMRAIFLRALGAVYLAAFWSMAVQIDGLIGSRGILPAGELLSELGPILGRSRCWQLPTLLWLDSSDRALHLLSWSGVVLGGLLVAGVLPRACLVLLWLGYLSIVGVGQPFFGYQWDALLLESGLLAMLFAPRGLWLGRAGPGPSRGVVWLLHWLVFRLMFLSGVVKLTSGDPTWRAWEAMKYHYETQPLPTWTSWWMHQLPPWFHAASVGSVFWAELIAPVFVFGPRRLRMLGFWSLVFLQVLIMATGNYGFFNLLSIVLCLSLVEDRDWGWVPSWGKLRDARWDGPGPGQGGWWHRLCLGGVGVVIVLVTTMEGLDRSGWTVVFPRPLEALRSGVAPLQSMNAYGLFAVMTTDRPEILVEGSADGVTWVPYDFRWKPGDVGRRPRFTTPHLPRLDWQMWFAALARDCRVQPWFLAFERRLLEGSPEVLGLLRGNPFPDTPPRYLRARLYQYRFTGRGAGAWWRRDEVGLYCSPLGLSRSEMDPGPIPGGPRLAIDLDGRSRRGPRPNPSSPGSTGSPSTYGGATGSRAGVGAGRTSMLSSRRCGRAMNSCGRNPGEAGPTRPGAGIRGRLGSAVLFPYVFYCLISEGPVMRRIAGSLLAGMLCCTGPFAPEAVAGPPAPIVPVVEVIPADEPTLYEPLRRVLVGPGLNEPEPYPGYTGFVGWQGIARTRTGALLVTFSSGYWHASPPTPLGAREKGLLKRYGIAEVDAPRGGRAHIMRSDDGGRTWSKPSLLIDTPGDDRAPAPVRLSDGTLLCSFFTWPPKAVGIIRSRDDGRTWEREPRRLRGPFRWTAGDGPPIELPDGSVLMATYAGSGAEDGEMRQGIFRSTDRGATWLHLATLDAPFDLDEPHIAALPDGRLMTICRREGALAWSGDRGTTWTAPVPLPFKMYDPWLLPLEDGTLLCVHGTYTEGKNGVRAILSPDGGRTWHAAGPDFGFAIDPSVYGYSRGVQLDDGSVYMVYMANGGHKPQHMKSQRIFAIRFRVKEGCRGIELLPAPGSPADVGKAH